MTGGIGAPAEAGDRTRTARGTTASEELSKHRRAIARRVAEAKATIPHLYARRSVDLDALERAGAGERTALTAAVVRACALALKRHPDLNSSYRDGGIERHERINVAIVVDGPDGPIAPTIFDAAEKSAEQIAGEVGELVRRAREGDLTSPALAGSTFTLTPPGGAEALDTIVAPGQGGSLSIGEPGDVAVVRDGSVSAGRRLTLSLSCDGRIVSAAEAGAFLSDLGESLEEPRLPRI